MAYDPATDGPALRAEVVDNQVHYGDPGNDAEVFRKLETKTADVAICRTPADSIAREFTGDDLLVAMTGSVAAAAEYDGKTFTASQQVVVDFLILYREKPIPGKFQDTLMHSTAGIFSLAGSADIRPRIIAEATGPKNMLEVLFGDDTTISVSQWQQARGPGTPSGDTIIWS